MWSLKDLEFEHIRTLSGHAACVLSLAVYGRWCFSGSYDTTVKVWNLDTLQTVETLHHMAKVESLVVTDRYIISGGTDNTIKIWSWRKPMTS